MSLRTIPLYPHIINTLSQKEKKKRGHRRGDAERGRPKLQIPYFFLFFFHGSAGGKKQQKEARQTGREGREKERRREEKGERTSIGVMGLLHRQGAKERKREREKESLEEEGGKSIKKRRGGKKERKKGLLVLSFNANILLKARSGSRKERKRDLSKRRPKTHREKKKRGEGGGKRRGDAHRCIPFSSASKADPLCKEQGKAVWRETEEKKRKKKERSIVIDAFPSTVQSRIVIPAFPEKGKGEKT